MLSVIKPLPTATAPSWEEKRVDDKLMDTEARKENKRTEEIIVNDLPIPEEELLEISNFRDEQIKKRNREQNEKEDMLRIQKDKSESKSVQMKSSKRRKKKKKISPEENEKEKLPSSLRHVPENTLPHMMT